MAEVEIVIEGHYKKTGISNLDKQLSVVVRQVFREIVNSIEDKSKEFARGDAQVPTHVGGQADHRIGQSESGYISTGELEEGIETIRSPVRGYSFSATVKSTSERSSNVEFGTGIYGKNMQVIKAKTPGGTLTFKTPKFGWVNKTSIRGQRPNPFMRGAVWWTQDHLKEILKTVQTDMSSRKIKELIQIESTVG